MKITVLGQTDFYKTGHAPMYPEDTVKISSNLTPRKSRIKGVFEVVVFGIQYFVLEFLIEQWNRNFFHLEMRSKYKPTDPEWQECKAKTLAKYKRLMDNTIGKGAVEMSHIEKLWDLGYMPLKIKALPEGTLCPIGVPCLTICNTIPHAYWLVNYLETILSCTVWQPMTSATIALQYRRILNKYAYETTGSTDFVQWQGHDFSMRGMSSLESACTSGAGHLLSFTGTDTVPAIEFLEQYYSADVEKELVGASVPATEHSVMCMGLKDGELATFARLLGKYPTGLLSVVSDTWDLWGVVRRHGICEQLRKEILAREGKLVIRPDSGNPVDILCGLPLLEDDDEGFWPLTQLKYERFIFREQAYSFNVEAYEKESAIAGTHGDLDIHDFVKAIEISEEEMKGVVECLWDIFGGIITDQGYKVLDQHIGCIYGDSITTDRAIAICERLKNKGFASTNVVLGIGSYTYQYNTRDTFGFAMKATYGEVMVDGKVEGREIFKDPITDRDPITGKSEKKSAKGRLRVDYDENGKIALFQQQTEEEENKGLLEVIFLDGKLVKKQTLAEIRERLSKAA